MPARKLFDEALAIIDLAERGAFLDRACVGQIELRRQLNEMLDAHQKQLVARQEPGDFVPDQTLALAQGPHPGSVIAGRYKLLEVIGEGGMGTVWVAEQTEPVRRKVALKLIKPGMDSRNVLARFEAERQALALMDHPSIAKVLDGGLTESQRPYFVMEYVKGIPITEYCDATRLSVRERLDLFVQVCQAVQHAHQKGIIHRDLKPSNILVAPYDNRPVPKVIDFGLAKAVHQSLTERTIHTGHEVVLGTPLYMSPEQSQLNNLDVDTRADVYSLGVLLYELLTGTTPLEKKRFHEAAWDQILRIIREEEPPRPSKRLESSQTLPALAAGRQSEPARLTRLIRGDLDWIVMKSIEKDRSRRYDSASGFAGDIQRYLTGEPVLAHPPTWTYRAGKFIRRHRTPIMMVGLALAALLGFVASLYSQVVRAKDAEELAETNRRRVEKLWVEAEQARGFADRRAEGERVAKLTAETRRAEALEQTKRAEKGEQLAAARLQQVESEQRKVEAERRIAQAVRDFLQHRLLGQADVKNQGSDLIRAGRPASEATPNPTIRDLLDRAARELTVEKIDKNFPDQPLVQAEILQTVGNTYRGIGDFEPAIGFLKRSLDLRRRHLAPADLDTLNAMGNLALTYQKAGMSELALPLHEETLRLFQAHFPADHPDALTIMSNLAGVYLAAREVKKALPLYEQVCERRKASRGATHPDTLSSMNNLAVAYRDAGEYDKSLALHDETYRRMKERWGPEHVETLISLCNLANAYGVAGKQRQALPLHEEALRLMREKLGPDHALTLVGLSSLASTKGDLGQREQAAALHEEALRRRSAALGPEHPDTLSSMNLLAKAYRDARQLDLALPLFEKALKLRTAILGPDHPDTHTSMGNLASTYWSLKQLDKSIPLFEEVLEKTTAKSGRNSPEALLANANLGVNYLDAGRVEEAIPLLEESHRGSPRNPSLRWVARVLLDAYARQGRSAQANKLAQEMLVEFRKTTQPESLPLAGELASLGRLLLIAKAYAESESMLRESLVIQEMKQPNHWLALHTKALLGGTLFGQGKYADAESLLVAGCQGMMKQEAALSPQAKIRLRESIERLVSLYEALEKPTEAATWRESLKEGT